MKTQLAIKRKY